MMTDTRVLLTTVRFKTVSVYRGFHVTKCIIAFTGRTRQEPPVKGQFAHIWGSGGGHVNTNTLSSWFLSVQIEHLYLWQKRGRFNPAHVGELTLREKVDSDHHCSVPGEGRREHPETD